MNTVEVELPPVTSNPDQWLDAMRRFHWRRSFECYAAELDDSALYHRKQAQHIERKLKESHEQH